MTTKRGEKAYHSCKRMESLDTTTKDWKTFKELMLKNPAGDASIKSVFLMVVHNEIFNNSSEKHLRFGRLEIQELDSFLSEFEDACLPRVFVKFKNFQVYLENYPEETEEVSEHQLKTQVLGFSCPAATDRGGLDDINDVYSNTGDTQGAVTLCNEHFHTKIVTASGVSGTNGEHKKADSFDNTMATSSKNCSQSSFCTLSSTVGESDAEQLHVGTANFHDSGSNAVTVNDWSCEPGRVSNRDCVRKGQKDYLAGRNCSASTEMENSLCKEKNENGLEFSSRTAVTKRSKNDSDDEGHDEKCKDDSLSKSKMNADTEDSLLQCSNSSTDMPLECPSNLTRLPKLHGKKQLSPDKAKCGICKASFPSFSKLQCHLKTHARKSVHKCSICEKTFSQKGRYSAHMKTHYLSKSFVCDVCSASFSSSAKLGRHKLVHSGKKRFTCTECESSFADRSHLIVHYRIHSGERPFKCDECDAAFTESTKLKNHKRSHSGEKPYVCEVCGSSFTVSSSLKSHMKVHSGVRPYKCDLCEFTAANSSNLRSHMRVHSGERKFTCEKCGASFSESAKLSRHKMVHSGEKPYNCDSCGARFADKSHLTVHLRIHSGERPFKCSVCSASFTESSKLKNHLRTHTGEKPYVCEICGSSFAVSNGLKSHMRRHTGEKPYKCNVCGYATSQSSNLKTHMNVHSGRKPYSCQDCGASFSENAKLQRHKVIHLDIPDDEESAIRDRDVLQCEKTLSDECLTKPSDALIQWHFPHQDTSDLCGASSVFENGDPKAVPSEPSVSTQYNISTDSFSDLSHIMVPSQTNDCSFSLNSFQASSSLHIDMSDL